MTQPNERWVDCPRCGNPVNANTDTACCRACGTPYTSPMDIADFLWVCAAMMLVGPYVLFVLWEFWQSCIKP